METTLLKRNDVIRFMTNGPQVHLMDMFGHCEFNPDEILKEKYIGRIKDVIYDGRCYLISTISPMDGFICYADADDVIGQLELSELTAVELARYNERISYMEAPNVYVNDAATQSGSIAECCSEAAASAMASLFPEQKTGKSEWDKVSLFSKDWYVNNMDHFLVRLEGKPRFAELKEKRDHLAGMFDRARFKPFYSGKVAVERPATDDDREFERQIHEALRKQLGKDYVRQKSVSDIQTISEYWMVAVSLDFKVVSIMRDITERSNFFRSLGPEFNDMADACEHFRSECINLL